MNLAEHKHSVHNSRTYDQKVCGKVVWTKHSVKGDEIIGKVYMGSVCVCVHRHALKRALIILNKYLLSSCSRPGIVSGTWTALMKLFLADRDTCKHNKSIVSVNVIQCVKVVSTMRVRGVNDEGESLRSFMKLVQIGPAEKRNE